MVRQSLNFFFLLKATRNRDFANFTSFSIIPKMRKIFLSYSGVDGGEWIEDNASVHPENIDLIKRALLFAELDIAGVDIISPDISKPLASNGGKIIEINAGPDTNIHANVNRGKKIFVEKEFVRKFN